MRDNHNKQLPVTIPAPPGTAPLWLRPPGFRSTTPRPPAACPRGSQRHIRASTLANREATREATRRTTPWLPPPGQFPRPPMALPPPYPTYRPWLSLPVPPPTPLVPPAAPGSVPVGSPPPVSSPCKLHPCKLPPSPLPPLDPHIPVPTLSLSRSTTHCKLPPHPKHPLASPVSTPTAPGPSHKLPLAGFSPSRSLIPRSPHLPPMAQPL